MIDCVRYPVQFPMMFAATERESVRNGDCAQPIASQVPPKRLACRTWWDGSPRCRPIAVPELRGNLAGLPIHSICADCALGRGRISAIISYIRVSRSCFFRNIATPELTRCQRKASMDYGSSGRDFHPSIFQRVLDSNVHSISPAGSVLTDVFHISLGLDAALISAGPFATSYFSRTDLYARHRRAL
ncbi:hypothetical protein FKP32DRAFT_895165 [Trametes sanguinea]|nr:hypothetical protein FKP32DRAFT_895165 [Trametes sanguinea]